MAQFTKVLLSASPNGTGILVTGTAATGTLIHTAPASGSIDEVWLYGQNQSASPLDLTIEFGGTNPINRLPYRVPASGSGLTLLVPGFILTGVGEVRAYSQTANQITIIGYANRIS
jgi:hypothetical protein